MFSFLKNWLSKDGKEMRSMEEIKQDIQEESTMSVEADGNEDKSQETDLVSTQLSLHPEWEHALDQEKKYTLRFMQESLPDMKDGTIGVTGFSLMPREDGCVVAMFFRNGTNQPYRFKEMELAILFDDKEFASEEFDLNEVGEIPPYSSRPWELFFPKETFKRENMLFNRWKLTMKLIEPRVFPNELDLDPKMEARMSEEQKKRLRDMIMGLPGLRANEVKATGYDIAMADDGRLIIAILFRNARKEAYKPKRLHLRIIDRAKDVVAEGTIQTTGMEVRPGTSRPWIVVFPADVVKKKRPDLSLYELQISER